MSRSEPAVIKLDSSASIKEFSPLAEALFGWGTAEMLGRPITDLIPELGLERVEAASAHTDIAHTLRAMGLRRDGSETELDVVIMARGHGAGRSATLLVAQTEPGVAGSLSDSQDLIEELREAEVRAWDAEGQFQALLDAAPDGVIVINHRGQIEVFNPTAERMFGYRAAEVVGRNVSILMPPHFAEAHDGYIARYLATGERHIIGVGREAEALRKDGTRFPIDLAVGEVRPDGIPRFVGIVRDISERQRQAEALDRERSRAQQYLDLAEVMMLALDPRGNVLLINRKGCQILGCEEQRIVGRNWFDHFLPANQRDEVREVFHRIMAGHTEGTEPHENRVLTAGGKERIIAWHNTLVREADGSIAASLSCGEDVTERRRMEEQVRLQEEELRLTFENAPLGTATLDLQGRFLRVNAALSRMLGYDTEDVTGLSFDRIIHADERQESAHELRRLLAEGDDTFTQERRFVDRQGRVLEGRLRMGVVHDAAGRPSMLIAQLEDQTEQLRAEQEAEQLRERLSHLDRLVTLGEMAAGIAHEINQPLSAIANYAHACLRLLKAGRHDDADLLHALEAVGGQAERAGIVIRRLRSLARKHRTERLKIDCNKLIRDVRPLAEADARAQDIRLELELCQDLPAVAADPIQIQQVVLNLIRNAVEATDQAADGDGCITVRTGRLDDTAIRVQVSDEGAGLTEAEAQQIFNPFFTTKDSGLGMGLSISRSIIAAHGGELDFEPNPTRGTTFYFTLPTAVID